ncbi:MAG: cation-translocating P-type ATPase [Gammaproteobacteria bacterium]
MNTTVAPTGSSLRLKIGGMDCGSCALTLEQALRGLPGVTAVNVNFTTETLEASGPVSRAAVEAKIRSLGYQVIEGTEPRQAPRPELRGLKGFLRFLVSERRTKIAVVATALLVAVTLADMLLGTDFVDIGLLLAVAIIGAPILAKGLRSLFIARHVTIDLLMGVASVGAFAIGETGEAVAVVLLFTLGEALEAYSAERSRDALRSLLSLQPDEATVLEPHDGEHGAPTTKVEHKHGADCNHDDHGQQHAPAVHYHQRRHPTSSVAIGARILVKPGERIPLDGQIIDGSSSINQAAVTGESMPVDRGVGDEVLAGTVNGSGALTINVLRVAGDSTVARIASMVEKALAERTPAERFIDRFARWYTPLVCALAALIVAIPVLVFGQPFLDMPDGTHGWLYRGLAMLIIACPCALIISTPVTVVSALTRLAALGVLVKGGAQLDRMASVHIIAFDKTGTLTVGHPAVTSILGRGCRHAAVAANDCNICEEVVAIAAAVEQASEHPLAQAVVASAQAMGVSGRFPQATGITAHVGRGVSGEISGERISVGTHALFAHGNNCVEAICDSAAAMQSSGKTVMLVGRGNGMLGFIGVEDQPRAESRAVLAELHALDSRMKTVMLTGDHRNVAESVASQIGGLDEIRAGLLPEDKLRVIRQLQTEGTVAMIGDGINDAPALAQADIGIAMGGGGTAQAMETADIVLMQDDLRSIPLVLRVSRQTRSVVQQNITLSLVLKLAILGLAIPGIASLWLAVLADVGATLIVTLNGMRLLRAR